MLSVPAAVLATASIAEVWAVEVATGFAFALVLGVAFGLVPSTTEGALGIGGLIAVGATLSGRGRCSDAIAQAIDDSAALGFTLVLATFVLALLAGVHLRSRRWAELPAHLVSRQAGAWLLSAFIVLDLGLFLLRPGGVNPWLGFASTWLLPVVAAGGATLVAFGLFLRTDALGDFNPIWIKVIVGTLLLAGEFMLWLQQPLAATSACERSAVWILLIGTAFCVGAFPSATISAFRGSNKRADRDR